MLFRLTGYNSLLQYMWCGLVHFAKFKDFKETVHFVFDLFVGVEDMAIWNIYFFFFK